MNRPAEMHGGFLSLLRFPAPAGRQGNLGVLAEVFEQQLEPIDRKQLIVIDPEHEIRGAVFQHIGAKLLPGVVRGTAVAPVGPHLKMLVQEEQQIHERNHVRLGEGFSR